MSILQFLFDCPYAVTLPSSRPHSVFGFGNHLSCMYLSGRVCDSDGGFQGGYLSVVFHELLFCSTAALPEAPKTVDNGGFSEEKECCAYIDKMRDKCSSMLSEALLKQDAFTPWPYSFVVYCHRYCRPQIIGPKFGSSSSYMSSYIETARNYNLSVVPHHQPAS